MTSQVKNILFFLTFCIFTIHCNSPSKEIEESFEKVNNSLTTTDAVLDTSLGELYKNLLWKQNEYPASARKARGVYFNTMGTALQIDSLIDVLRARDSAGDNLTVASDLLLDHPAGDQLEISLLHIAHSTQSVVAEGKEKDRLNTILKSINEMSEDKSWRKKYFQLTPTVAAITMLNKFKNDIKNAGIVTLTYITNHPEK